jgi:hypothetical protein
VTDNNYFSELQLNLRHKSAWESQNTPAGCVYMLTVEDIIARMDEYDVDRTTLVARRSTGVTVPIRDAVLTSTQTRSME